MIGAYLLASLVSAGLAFFGVFNILFSDVATAHDRLWSWAYVFVIYAIAGGAFALAWPRAQRRWQLWFALPAVAVVAFVCVNEPGTLRANLAGGLFALLGLMLGTSAGARLR